MFPHAVIKGWWDRLEAQPQNRLNLHRGQGINSEILKAKQGFYSLNDLFPGLGCGDAFTIPVIFGTSHHTLLASIIPGRLASKL